MPRAAVAQLFVDEYNPIMSELPKILLIDSSALIHRAYHALPSSMTNAKGEPTNAVYGFTSALISTLNQLKPTHVVGCFDVTGGTFRDQEYSQYKAHRKAMDDDLAAQIPHIYKVAEAFQIPIMSKTGFEADDLIGTLAKRFEGKAQVLILTGDKDALQLVSAHTSVITLRSGMKDPLIYTPATMQTEYGITPLEFIMYKALRGDPSDNIPGVKGVGEVTALKLVQQYNSLDMLYKALTEDPTKHPLLKGKLREALEAEKEIAYLSYKLATIDTNVEVDLNLDQAKRLPLDRDRIDKLFNELQFSSLFSRLQSDNGRPSHSTEPVAEVEVLAQDQFIQALKTTGPFAATATVQGKAKRDQNVTAIAVAFDGKKPLVTLWNKAVAQALKALFEDPKTEKRLYDVKWWMHALGDHQIILTPPYVDVMVQKQLLQEPLDSLAPLHHKDEISSELLQQAAQRAVTLFSEVPRLDQALKQATLSQLWTEIELPLIPVVTRMEQNGVLIDCDILEKQSKECDTELNRLQKEIWHVAGQEFNIASPAQLREILFDKMMLGSVGVKKKKTGLSTDAETLEALRPLSPIIDLILQHRELSKLKGTYLDALPKLVDDDGRVRTTYNQVGSATGRISSTDPNLQNIPIRTERGDAIRQAFVSSPGNALVGADYSQIELRILAHLSGDKAMIESFRDKYDIHLATASRLNNVPIEQVTKEMRRAAKTINFGLLYGLSAHRLSISLGISFKEAQEFMERYFATYPGVKTFLAEIVATTRKQGHYYTMFGRRRNFPDITSSVWALKQASERMAMNFPMQGAQADILKKAMVAVHQHIQNDRDIKLMLTVHDELVFELPKDRALTFAKELQSLMTGVATLKVPLEVDVRSGTNWGAMQPVV